VIDAPHSHPSLTLDADERTLKKYHDIFGTSAVYCLTVQKIDVVLLIVSSPVFYYALSRSNPSVFSKTATVDFAIIFHDGDRPELYSSQVRRLQPPNLPTPSAGSSITDAQVSRIRAVELNSTNTRGGQQCSNSSSRCTK
jgi:hypothetical protein